MRAEAEPKPRRRRNESSCGASVARFAAWVGLLWYESGSWGWLPQCSRSRLLNLSVQIEKLPGVLSQDLLLIYRRQPGLGETLANQRRVHPGMIAGKEQTFRPEQFVTELDRLRQRRARPRRHIGWICSRRIPCYRCGVSNRAMPSRRRAGNERPSTSSIVTGWAPLSLVSTHRSSRPASSAS